LSLLSRLRDFTRSQSRNYRILLIRRVVASFLSRLVQNFSNLYIVELVATAFQLSEVRAAGSAVNGHVSIPAGWLSDVYSMKKIMILGMILQIASIAWYAFARSWEWIIVAIISGP
jgi:MFS family permease